MFPLLDPARGAQLCGENSSFYMALLKRFAQDDSVPQLLSALGAGDAQLAFLHAHTLKGLCAQLALPALQDAAQEMCALCTHARLDRARSALPALLDLYQQTLAAIRTLTHSDS